MNFVINPATFMRKDIETISNSHSTVEKFFYYGTFNVPLLCFFKHILLYMHLEVCSESSVMDSEQLEFLKFVDI